MTTLTLLIDERWPENPAADWVLAGPRGELVQQGRSEPRHWPGAERQVAVLNGAQVSLCSVLLPKSRRQDRQRLMAYALEERLPADTDGQHFTLIQQDGERAVLALVDTQRLRRVLDAFAAMEKPLSGVFGRLQCLPCLDGTAVCVDENAMRYWRWPDGTGLAEDLPQNVDEPVSWLAKKVRPTMAFDKVLGPQSVADAFALPQVTDSKDNSLPWHGSLRNIQTASNLLHGPFAPRQLGGTWSHRLRWPLRISAAAIAIHLLAGITSTWMARQTEAQLNAKTRAIFQSIFPGAALVDPVLQLRRQLNELRSKNGSLRDDEMITLLAMLSDALGANSRDTITRLRYEPGVLEISVGPGLDPKSRQALIDALAMRGISAQAVAGVDNVLSLRRSAS